MKRFLILLLPISLVASELHTLRRCYSMHPLVDKLKWALLDDADDLAECLENGLPYALDRQFVLLGLEMSDEVECVLLEAIEDQWYRRIRV